MGENEGEMGGNGRKWGGAMECVPRAGGPDCLPLEEQGSWVSTLSLPRATTPVLPPPPLLIFRVLRHFSWYSFCTHPEPALEWPGLHHVAEHPVLQARSPCTDPLFVPLPAIRKGPTSA